MTRGTDKVLKPCPFCGYSVAKVSETEIGWFVAFVAECDADTADGCGVNLIRSTKQAAITAWNTRNGDGVPEARCISCGMAFPSHALNCRGHAA